MCVIIIGAGPAGCEAAYRLPHILRVLQDVRQPTGWLRQVKR